MDENYDTLLLHTIVHIASPTHAFKSPSNLSTHSPQIHTYIFFQYPMRIQRQILIRDLMSLILSLWVFSNKATFWIYSGWMSLFPLFLYVCMYEAMIPPICSTCQCIFAQCDSDSHTTNTQIYIMIIVLPFSFGVHTHTLSHTGRRERENCSNYPLILNKATALVITMNTEKKWVRASRRFSIKDIFIFTKNLNVIDYSAIKSWSLLHIHCNHIIAHVRCCGYLTTQLYHIGGSIDAH